MRNYLDKTDKINEIKLLFNHPLYKKKVILIVEGNSDIRLFRSILRHDQLAFESIDGKKQLIEAMINLSAEYPKKVLAICDADQEHLLGTSEHKKSYSIYMTDYHDIEIMMIKSPAMDSFIQEFSNNANIDQLLNELLRNILDAAYPIGLLRWINAEEDLNLKFKGLNFNLFTNVNKTSIEVDIDTLTDELIRRSKSKPNFVDAKYLRSKISSYDSRNGCELQVCCGHDISNIIAIVYRQRWASHETNMDVKKVESALRIAYQKEYLTKTELYRQISGVLVTSGIGYEIG